MQEEKEELIHFLKEKKINSIYINKKITTEEIICLLKEKNLIKQKKKENNFIKNQEIKTEHKKIFVTGARGIGKSVFIAILAKELSLLNKRVLIINLSEENNSFKILFGKQEKNKIIKIKTNIFLWNETNKFKEEELKKQEKQFDYLFFEGIKIEKKEIENKNINSILVLVEPNLLEISKTQELLKNIREEEIKIIFNKKTEQSIDEKILKNLFSNYKIIGKINYDSFFQKLINKNMKEKIIKNKIKKEINKIVEKIK